MLSGAGTGEFVTGGAGTMVVPDLKEGVYRLRCEREGFITLERELTMKGGQPGIIDVVLSAAPALAAVGPVSYTHLTLPTIYSV